jgi:hypothetical protein
MAYTSLWQGIAVEDQRGRVPLVPGEGERQLLAPRAYEVRCFAGREWDTLRCLCDLIIPADAAAGGALEAGAPEFIDYMASEMRPLRRLVKGGLRWLDITSRRRTGRPFLDCARDEQHALLEPLSRPSVETIDPELRQGVHFFRTVRKFTVDGFITSAVGIRYLEYIGNTQCDRFPGCP